ncbi:Oligopeptidase A [Planctomycetes bacterium Pla163]|uniref:Oligopeptidase A n=1 Tax=Rohdeia mirabilis TaxID=2528008 RepID=A0A518CWU4_9BACT|nr:Oligopeptidase A [Planctomycetes bacterium Pla163]
MHITKTPTADDLRPFATARLDEARARLADLKALAPDAAGLEVCAAYDAIGRALNGLGGWLGIFANAHPDEATRTVAEELEQELSAFGTELSLDRDVFAALERVDVNSLADEQARRLIEHGLRDYRRSGIDKDDATRARIVALKKELVEIGQQFDRNIMTGGKSFKIAEGAAGLDGLPADFVANHPPAEDGSVTLSTDPNDRVPFMTYATRGDLRQAYSLACNTRAYPENLPVLKQIMTLRHELANALGFASWADYVTEDKMSKSGANAREFVDRVMALAKDRAAAEYDELLEYKRREDPSATDVRDWEKAYLSEKVKADRYSFDSLAVRPYFAYAKVRDGVIATSEVLFGVRFERNDEIATWHPSVEVYDVRSKDGGEHLARLFLDMHPRDGKFKHAAMFSTDSGLLGGDSKDEVLPQGALMCNFPEPKGTDPGLMLHDEVTTFFHEIGHLLHHLFSARSRYVEFSGISTEWDFVEVPSQLYEEWAWDTGVLQRFATHHQTGEPIPEPLIDAMRRAEEYGKGLTVIQQMYFATMSLEYYMDDPAKIDPVERMIALREEHLPFPHEEGTFFLCGFGHLHGYSAMYYTYMWSLVIAKDILSAFSGDLMNPAVAQRYYDEVLSRGGTKDAADLVANFLGREQSFEAFAGWLQR